MYVIHTKGFNVEDRIQIEFATDSEQLLNALKSHESYICRETLADNLKSNTSLNKGNEFNIEDSKILIHIQKA